MRDFFERAFCINLDRRPDRWERFVAGLPDDWPFARPLRFDAIDGRRVPAPPWWTAGRGAWGCYRSHLRLIERCLSDGVRSVLILEDDAAFGDGFTERAAEFLRHVPDDWGMLYLGGEHFCDCPPRPVNEHVSQVGNVSRTHAYALRGRTLRAVYEHLTSRDWRQGHHIDHHLGRFHERRDHPVYCPREWLVGQHEGRSNITGRRHPERFWQAAESPESRVQSPGPEEIASPFVAVVGLHSSGSSCLAGVLHHLGVHMGGRFSGYWDGGYEDAGLARLMERAIRFPRTRLRQQPRHIEAALRQWIVRQQREATERGTVAGGKYPHLCRVGDQFRFVCGDQLRVLFIDRPIAESIASLKRRCPDKDPARLEAHQRWLAEGRDELRAAVPAEHQLSVEYADLLDDPAGQVRRVIDWLGIEPSQDQRDRAVASVHPDQRHVGREPVVLETERIAREVTIGFTAFRRPGCVVRLVESIRERYPTAPILVAENGDQPADVSAFSSVEVLRLPFDCGISASRNAMVERVETPYFWLLDDDLVFTDQSDCGPLLDVLDSDPAIGVVGGVWLDERPGQASIWTDWALDLSMEGGVLRGTPTRQTDQWTAAGTHHYGSDTAQQFALFRAAVFRGRDACLWDEGQKIQEHWDYYWRLKLGGRWRVAVCPSVRCRHARVVTPQYEAFRGRVTRYNSLLRRKWGLRDVRLARIDETPPRPEPVRA